MFGTQQPTPQGDRHPPIWAVTLHYQWTVTITLPSDDRGLLLCAAIVVFLASWVRADTLRSDGYTHPGSRPLRGRVV